MMTVAAFGLALGMMAANAQIVSTTDTFGSGANTFTMDFVTVGNPGNANDSGPNGGPFGGVASTYRMGTYEVRRDMAVKANAVGNLGITLADMMSSGGNCANRPATGVSWNEAARFVNWLNTSKGYSAAYKFTLQPGDVSYNANSNIVLWDPLDVGYNPNNRFRNSNAFYFLPSEGEWYKAACHKNDGVTANYFDYATGSDTAPTAVASGTTAGTAVYNQASATGPADVTLAGGLSPYGTMGQNGNVWEWSESGFTAPNDSSSEDRARRGGYWFNAGPQAA